MARMPIARATKRRANTGAAQAFRLDDANNAFIALVNISRRQVQGRGRGARTLFNPGQIDGDKTKMCIQEVTHKVGMKMYANRKLQLRPMTIQRGRRLLALARELAKQGYSDPFFTALARQYPTWAQRNEVDVAYEKRRLISARNVYKQKFGMLPPETMSVEQIEASNRDVFKGASGDMGAEAKYDPFLNLQDADLSGLLDDVPSQDEQLLKPNEAKLSEEEEGGGDEEPESLESLKARVESSTAAEIAQVKKILAEQYGIKSFRGNPGLAKLKEILAGATAAKAAS